MDRLIADGTIAPSKPLADRPIDLFFAGSIHPELPTDHWLPRHRLLLIDELRRLQQQNASSSRRIQHHPINIVVHQEHLDPADYFKTMCNAKIFVSPFGYGEWSIKDEEATRCQTIVIKPGASWFDTGPIPLYEHVKDITLKFDFSNLEDVVRSLLSNPTDLQRRSTAIGRSMKPYTGMDNLLQRKDVLEQFASVLRPVSVSSAPSSGNSHFFGLSTSVWVLSAIVSFLS